MQPEMYNTNSCKGKEEGLKETERKIVANFKETQSNMDKSVHIIRFGWIRIVAVQDLYVRVSVSVSVSVV